jgi:DNA-directed RNA polymerase subunit M/transcription elongation factor TFIIS
MACCKERLIIRGIIAEACAKHPKWPTAENPANKATIENPVVIVENMERSCLNAAVAWAKAAGLENSFSNPAFTDYYSALAFKVVSNLDASSQVGSTHLLDGILSNAVRPRDVATMTAVEMCPAASAAEREEIETRSRQRLEDNYSYMHKCKKCGESKTEIQEHQTRSADEMATITAICVTCGNMWRV